MMYLCFLCVLCAVFLIRPVLVNGHYTRQWAVHIIGGPEVADAVATDHGFINLGQVIITLLHIFRTKLLCNRLTLSFVSWLPTYLRYFPNIPDAQG